MRYINMLMKRNFAIIAALLVCFAAAAGNENSSVAENTATEAPAKKKKEKKPVQYNEQGQIIKTGLNFGPLPAVAFDADKGFQVGAILNIFDYGDGSDYPNYFNKTYFEASYYTKGSMLFQVMHDNKKLIPGVRWSTAAVVSIDKAFDFYGFNGYQSYLDYGRLAIGKANKKGAQDPMQFLYTPYYRTDKLTAFFKTDFVGRITDHLFWEAGYNLRYFSQKAINRASINKGKPEFNIFPDTEKTLYEQYIDWGLISPEETMIEEIGGHKKGFFNSQVRLGMVYDTRDKEGAPTRGIWAEAHTSLAPKWLGTTNPYYRYSITFRHYLPIVKNDVLTFAYRLNYEGNFGKNCPYYVLPYITLLGENDDKDGMGGYRTVRGILRDRVMGLDMATYTAEFRYRFVNFKWLKQNMSFALSLFSDGTMVTRKRSMEFNSPYEAGTDAYNAALSSYNDYRNGIAINFTDGSKTTELTRPDGFAKEIPHITAGAGLRFIMNENFIVAFEYGMPISRFYKKTSPYYMQDGTGAFYINIGYLF